MGWFWGFLIFFVVLVAGSFWFSYVAAERMVGREAARRNLRYAIPWFLFWLLSAGFALVFAIQVHGRDAWVSFHILSTVAISAWWIIWFFRRQEAGLLLADLGRNLQNKIMFWGGLLQVPFVVSQTWLFFTSASDRIPKYTSLEIEISRLVLGWFLPIFFISLGLSKLKFRENGICFMYSLIRWQRINSCTWDTDELNVLTIRLKTRFPLLAGFTSLSLSIPARHKEVASRILAERLPGKRL